MFSDRAFSGKTACALLLVFALCFAALSACGGETSATEPAQTEPAQIEAENPVVYLIGTYQNDLCELTIEAAGTNGAKITGYQGTQGKDRFRFTMSGVLDEAAMSISYADAVKESVVFTEAKGFTVKKKVFKDGTGSIQVNGDGSLTWNDDHDPSLASTPLTYVRTGDEEAPQ